MLIWSVVLKHSTSAACGIHVVLKYVAHVFFLINTMSIDISDVSFGAHGEFPSKTNHYAVRVSHVCVIGLGNIDFLVALATYLLVCEA